MFSVTLAAGTEESGSRKVGELDEEMVYESRINDVFALGATSWRIQEITHDRVVVTPAFGQPARLPFWKGDSVGRPYELGEAIGQFVRELSTLSPKKVAEHAAGVGLGKQATDNLVSYLHDQRQATGHIPSDRSLVVERFRDELGDWRVVLHSPFGRRVHAPWALAVAARIIERYGIDGSVVASDDGIVARIPDTEVEPPGGELFVFDADELDKVVTAEVGGSALFASRFRECAARALLLPRRNPGSRAPLWQQRQRSAQLLDVARNYPEFPILLETARECLQDVYDLPALTALSRRIASREISIVEVTTDKASPFAQTLLFGYVAAFLYEGDTPLAERRASALTLDPTLLAELLGRAELRELLDPEVIERTEHELQRLADDRRAKDVEGVADLLRMLGPLSATEVAARLEPDSASNVETWLAELRETRRAVAIVIAGDERWAAVEDAARLRDAPRRLPAARHLRGAVGAGCRSADRSDLPLRAHAWPLHYRRGSHAVRPRQCHRPSGAAASDSRWSSDRGRVQAPSHRIGVDRARRAAPHTFSLTGRRAPTGRAGRAGDLSPDSFRHGKESARRCGVPRACCRPVDQLAGLALPASAWESLVLPARVRDYSPAMLDELTSAGEVVWIGRRITARQRRLGSALPG